MNKSTQFLKEIFGPVTQHPVWIQSLGNPGENEERPSHVATRDMGQIEGFIKKWDRPGRGLYFAVSTINGPKRTKEHAGEIIGLHTDIDFKDADATPAEVDRNLTVQYLPPSIVNHSGNGRHAFWLFKEAIEATPDNQARVEMALKQLADVWAGDMAVTHCVALMRLPGTHNTKFGQSTEVTTLADTGARYELDDLEDWLAEQSPVILRKIRPATITADTNPFMAHALANGFKPSIDVEKRLSTMSYMGGGDAAIHATQLAVSASLLKSGTDTEDAVATILEATKGAATGYGERWNWQREEKAIRKMCSDWLKKHPQEQVKPDKVLARGENNVPNLSTVSAASGKRPHAENEAAIHRMSDGAGGGAAQVVAIAPKRAQKQAKGGISHHVILGGAVLAAIRHRGEDILCTAGEIWRYQDGLWREADEGRWLEVELETGAHGLELPSTIKLINEARKWLLRQPELYRGNVPWDGHGKVSTRSGLLDVQLLKLEPAQPEHFATWRIECDYQPDAECPWWLVMLNDFFSDRRDEVRAATITTLQEILGAALMEDKPRALTRALVLEGPSEAGKTRILDVLSGLFGDRPIATPLDALAGTHGLMEFRRRAPWVLHEAFNAGQWHMSSVVKSILTGDPVQINVKNGALTTQRIKAPVFWGTNHPPQFKEATKAIVNRLIVIKCRTVFDSQTLIGAAKEARVKGYSEPSDLILTEELPGLLNWAIVGLQRAKKQGYISTTDEVISTMEKVRQDSNMVAGFLDECADYSSSAMISVPDFCAAFSVWWIENKGEDRKVPSNETIGRAMTALGDSRIAADGSDLRDMHRRYYAGVFLNSIGLDYWVAASSEGLAKGKTARTSTSRNDVNRVIPDAWADRDAVISLRKSGMTVGMTVHDSSAENDSRGMTVEPQF